MTDPFDLLPFQRLAAHVAEAYGFHLVSVAAIDARGNHRASTSIGAGSAAEVRDLAAALAWSAQALAGGDEVAPEARGDEVAPEARGDEIGAAAPGEPTAAPEGATPSPRSVAPSGAPRSGTLRFLRGLAP